MASPKRKLLCTCCSTNKVEGSFYLSTSTLHQGTGRVHVCKDCVINQMGTDTEDLSQFKSILSQIDKPYLHDLYIASVEEAEKTNSFVFAKYMKNVAMQQYRNLYYSDSRFSLNDEADQINNLSIEDDENLTLTKQDKVELIKFWGKGYALDEYLFLQNEFEDFKVKYAVDGKNMEEYVFQICLTKLDIMRTRQKGSPVKDLLATYQSLFKNAGLNPAQENEASAEDQKETYGMWIKRFENDKPIPKPDPAWADVDSISKYIRVFFTGHIARMLGMKTKSAKLSEEYKEEMAKYTAQPIDREDEDEEMIDFTGDR